jgi:hypothetical protein
MYVSHQALRILGGDRMTAAEQRQADEQLGRIVAALSRSRRRFRKVGQPESPPGASDSAHMLSQSARKECPAHYRPAPTGARR